MLEVATIRKRLESPSKASELKAARDHEARVRFHSQTAFEARQHGTALTRYLAWVQELIPADKYHIFTSLLRFPMPTISLTDEAYKALEKVFDGRNAAELFEFTTPEAENDWQEYRAEMLHSPWVWREEGFEVMKGAINSLVVVDLPETPGPGLPEPYFYFLGIENVLDYEMKGDGLAWVIFEQPGDRIAVIDDTSWRVFTAEGRTIKTLEKESPHGLGYCPARFFWSTPVMRTVPEVKRSPITNALGDLDWHLFFSVSKRHLDLYAPYPIYSGFAADCDYEIDVEQTYEQCDGGFLKDREGRYLLRNGRIAECPACSKKRIAGVGSFVEVPAPSMENNNADLRNPVQITTVDRASLDYNTEELERQRAAFLEQVTGFAGEKITAEAVNEKQVKAFFESRTNVLRSLKKDLETIQEWTEATICRLRYGAAFVSATIDYGTEFYLLQADDLLDLYIAARDSGAGMLTLDLLQDQYLDTRFRNNPAELERSRMIVDIEPLRHIANERAAQLLDQGVISRDDYAVKANFSSLLMRFERENGPVTRFDIASAYDKRIQRIYETLISYTNTTQDESTTTEEDRRFPQIVLPGALAASGVRPGNGETQV
jgi:hypothetical protein